MTLQPLLQEMQSLGALLAGRAMLHNSSHREDMLHAAQLYFAKLYKVSCAEAPMGTSMYQFALTVQTWWETQDTL